jgi:5-methylcytosine-specific restriction protein B
MKYISTDSIVNAYNGLIEIDVKNASVLHIFLILKGCGINDISYENTEIIAEKGLQVANDLSSLFSYFEQKPEKYDFINPFSMNEWGAQAPSESLKKWVSSRIKNNIIGGATTWRKIIREDMYESKIKFAHNYVEEIKLLTIPENKIKLWPLVVWFNRFNKFERQHSPNELIQGFINELNLTQKEIGLLFDKSITFNITFEQHEAEMFQIRNLIGTPKNIPYPNWSESIVMTVQEPESYYNLKSKIMNNQKTISINKIEKLIKDNFQIILSGPPGTSKSFIANKTSLELTKDNMSSEESILKIQFHPQYTYQDFIGGFIVNGDKVEGNRGVLLRFLDRVQEFPKDKFVLIIDEINRANVSSVFGELIQCLDRNYSTSILIAGREEIVQLPKNLYLIATMNTSDRTLSSMDFALKRRFVDIYIGTNEDELIDNTETECKISLADLLKKINTQLRTTLRNNELVIGHTIFYNDSMLTSNKYFWNNENLEDLFNYKILSIIEDYCNKENTKVNEVIGHSLSQRLIGEDFINSINEYLS